MDFLNVTYSTVTCSNKIFCYSSFKVQNMREGCLKSMEVNALKEWCHNNHLYENRSTLNFSNLCRYSTLIFLRHTVHLNTKLS